MVDTPKVEFAVGSEVSHASFYKSAFARSFAINSRETKSLDFGFVKPPDTIAEEPNSLCNSTNDNRNNNFLHHNGADIKLWRINEKTNTEVEAATTELDKLRKECQSLAEENQRLQGALATGRISHSRVIDSVLLQSQIETLQWQLKQTEANRQMYRALMSQVVRFLERAHKSLEILHEKSSPKNTKTSSGGAARVPRSRSVHAVEGSSSSPNRSSISGPTSSFARAKSVTQISGGGTTNAFVINGAGAGGGGGGAGGGGNRDSTSSVWSVLRRAEGSSSPGGIPQSREDDAVVVYRRRPKQSENDPDEVPADRLSQEAFRLLRTVQSLLATREPDLARVSEGDDSRSTGSPPPLPNFVSPCKSNADASGTIAVSGTTGTEHETGGRALPILRKPESGDCLLPGARRSLDATSIHSSGSSSKATETTEEEDASALLDREFPAVLQSSTPNRRCKNPSEQEARFKPKPPASVSSAEDESGFSSMSSFQDVGLPPAPSPVKGCHTEVGLPEVPVSKVRHRRWSSTPAAEIQALLNARVNNSNNNNNSNAFAKNPNAPNEALKVLWV